MPGTTRLPLIGDETADATLHRLFERARSGFSGGVPNLYRTLGHAPGLLEGWITFAWSLRHDATTPRAERAPIVVAEMRSPKPEGVEIDLTTGGAR